ncbi:MAG: hypothetical protein E6Q58_00085 [Niabella sp.]|nr:MAG: hypothetical protein E6Q58_00085 [Niabella sp.]
MNNSNNTDLDNSIVSSAKTAGIAAIISVLGTIAGIIIFILSPQHNLNVEGQELDEATRQAAKIVPYISVIFSAIIGGLSFYFLFRFSLLAQRAVKTNDEPKLVKAFLHLAGYLKIWGVLLFFIIGFMGLAFLGGIVSAMFK